jgi:hypothetical protein
VISLEIVRLSFRLYWCGCVGLDLPAPAAAAASMSVFDMAIRFLKHSTQGIGLVFFLMMAILARVCLLQWQYWQYWQYLDDARSSLP